jgi:hypothetical protein
MTSVGNPEIRIGIGLVLMYIATVAGLVRMSLGRSYHCPPHVSRTRAEMKGLEQAVVHYQTDHGDDACPRTIGQLVAERYLTTPPLDAWGHPMVMHCPCRLGSDSAHFVSAGPDGLFDTWDDVRSWEAH